MKLLFPSMISLCLAFSISFLSCQSKVDVIGEYKLSTEGLELSEEEEAFMKAMGGSFKLVLEKDNKLKFTMMGQDIEGTYKLDGNIIELTMQGDTEKATVDGNKIMMESQGQKMLFIKTE